MCGNILCVCVCGCERMLKRERMLMSIAERLSPFFSQRTGCSQGKWKTHEASCPLPTGNVPTCTRTCTRTHTENTHTETPRGVHTHKHISTIAPSPLHFSLSFFLSFMFQELLAWIRSLLLSVRYSALSVMAMTSRPYPLVRYIPTWGTARLQRFTALLDKGWESTSGKATSKPVEHFKNRSSSGAFMGKHWLLLSGRRAE